MSIFQTIRKKPSLYLDVDECQLGSCGGNERSVACENLAGGYRCICESGYWFPNKVYGAGCEKLGNFCGH